MSKFNTTTKEKTYNLAGGKAYKVNEKFEFISILLTSFVQSKFYEKETDIIIRVKELFEKIKDKLFVAKAAIYARNEFGMRSISHIVAGEVAKQIKGQKWTKVFQREVVRRVDDITEILSYYISNYGKPIPNQLKKGLGMAFNKFDEYQLAKYRASDKKLSLIDAVNLLHPVGNDKNKEALKKLVDDTLRQKSTWEAGLSAAGKKKNVQEAKKDIWKELLLERKIGYFALLRNLRNITEQAPELIDKACELLIDEKLIKNSLVLPFRFVTAFKEINDRRIMIALNKAIDISASNCPKFDGNTCVVLDVSGSMIGKPQEIGSLFASILFKSNDADIMLFSDDAGYKNPNPLDSITTIADSIGYASGGTRLSSAFFRMNRPYDRIIILSDMQSWVETSYGNQGVIQAFNKYKQDFGCSPLIYSWDLKGYGTIQFPEQNVYLLTGWSEKVFDIIKLLEQDKNALIKKIEEIQL